MDEKKIQDLKEYRHKLENKTSYSIEELEENEEDDDVITSIRDSCDFELQGEEFEYIDGRECEGFKYSIRDHSRLYKRVSDGKYFYTSYSDDRSMGYHDTEPDGLIEIKIKEETRVVIIW